MAPIQGLVGLGGGATGGLVRVLNSTLGDQNNPAVNGQDINAAGRPTGWYWIQTSLMSSAKPIYVNNDDEGGGWMLISYDYNVNASSNGVPYPHYFSESTVPSGFSNMTIATDAYQLWYSSGSAQITQSLHMWNANTGNSVPLLSNMSTASKVTYSNPSNFVNANISGTGSSSVATTTTSTKLSGTWYNVKNRTSFGNAIAIDAPCDWLYNDGSSTFYWTPCGPANDLTSDGRSGNGLSTGMWMNNGNSDFYGGLDNGNGSAQNTNNKTFALYIK